MCKNWIQKKDWVMHSTEQSMNQQQISLLAMIETVFFTGLTWGIALYFDWYGHIVSALLIAPLLLLKTPASIKQANTLFLKAIYIPKEGWYKH